MSTDEPDLLRQAWQLLFVGDAPGNTVLRTHPDGTSEVVAYVPAGGTEPRTVLLGRQPVQVDTPALREELVSTGALSDVVDALRRRTRAQEHAALAELDVDEREQFREMMAVHHDPARRDAWITTMVDLGSVGAWLADHTDDPDAGMVARGDLVGCRSCRGTGRAYEVTCDCRQIIDLDAWELTLAAPDCPECAGRGTTDRACAHCAGTGRRRTRLTVRLHDPDGRSQDVELSAATAHLQHVHTRVDRTRYPRHPGEAWPKARDRFAVHWPVADLATNLALPAPDAMLVIRDGYTYPGPHRQTSTDNVGQVVRAMLALVPAGSHPDLGASWRDTTEAERGRRLAACTYDAQGRMTSQVWHLRRRRPLTQAWHELVGHAADLERALPAGWRSQASLSTGAIATGEHGPQVQLVALPPHLLERPIAAVSVLDYDLEAALETAVWRAVDAGPKGLAADVAARQ